MGPFHHRPSKPAPQMAHVDVSITRLHTVVRMSVLPFRLLSFLTFMQSQRSFRNLIVGIFLAHCCYRMELKGREVRGMLTLNFVFPQVSLMTLMRLCAPRLPLCGCPAAAGVLGVGQVSVRSIDT